MHGILWRNDLLLPSHDDGRGRKDGRVDDDGRRFQDGDDDGEDDGDQHAQHQDRSKVSRFEVVFLFLSIFVR